jgi:hypothetical protein
MGLHKRYGELPKTPGEPTSPLTIPDDSITSAMIQDNAIMNHHIRNEAITQNKLDSFLVEWLNNILGVVNTDDIADGAVTTPKIADANITQAKIANGAIYSAHLQNDCVLSDAIADTSIFDQHISPGTITNVRLADETVDSDKIKPGAIDSNHFSDNAKTAFVKPSYTDKTAPTETGSICQNDGKVFIPLGEILLGADAILLIVKCSAAAGSDMSGIIHVYGSGTSDLAGLKEEASAVVNNRFIIGEESQEWDVPIPALISLVHKPVSPVGEEEYDGIVLEITNALIAGTDFTYSVEPYGILDGMLVES